MTELTELTFEEAFRQLEEAVQKLEEGDLSLEESIALFERGMKLVAYCQDQLDKAELRVKKLVPLPGGGYETAPFEPLEE